MIKQPANPSTKTEQTATLKRAISLPKLVMYGLGTTIGAGIYVLVGETAARAGAYAPLSFLAASIVMAFSAASFAEFSGRVPVSAGEAAYIDQGFHLPWLSAISGYTIILAAIVAAAAISLGCAGYVAQIIPVSEPIIVCAIFLLMGGLAIWGIQESISIAAILTIIEVVGLLVIIVAGFYYNPNLIGQSTQSMTGLHESTVWVSVLSASLIAFFAFIGFDDVVNVVEETVNPAKVMPKAIAITLLVVTVLYVLISIVALDVIPLNELSSTRAPISLLFERLTGISPFSITLIAIAATMNGIVIQIIMGSRVAYGLSKKRYLPAKFSSIYPLTRTPVFATIAITLTAVAFALFLPLDRLAEFTSQLILFIFFLVNTSLVLVKLRKEQPPEGIFLVHIIVPVLGAIGCFLLLVGPMVV